MSKPVRSVRIATVEGKTGRVKAVVDTGSYYTIIRLDCLPKGSIFPRFRAVQRLRTANRSGRLQLVGATVLTVVLAGKRIRDDALVALDLSSEMLIGAGTMQAWDISVRNRNGKTKVTVGRDMRDPEITEVD